MIVTFIDLFSWLPVNIQLIVAGVLAFFFFWAFLKIIAIIIEIIPFV